MSRYNRANFYETFTVNDLTENDFIKSKLDLFKIKRPTKFYTVQTDDLKRPDLISLKNYNRQDFWWIIGYVNQIMDWWHDISAGDVIQLPDEKDIQDWYLLTRG